MIRISNITKRFPAQHETVRAIEDLSLEIEPHSFFTLLGPSGCGKSTLLRCIAGLERPDEGVIHIGDKMVFSSKAGINVPPNKRQIGMVFQSYAIWPHMTVFQNVAFPLQARRMGDVKARVDKALTMVGLETHGDRYASRLSGGQQQRVAFARAVVAEPELLLLDEPLSNLDAALREQMRSELRSFQERIGITTIYVTHDQAEALSMSDRIAVMQNGRFVEIDAPENLYNRPRREFTARFLGGANILEGTTEAGEGGLRVHTTLGVLRTASSLSPPPGTRVNIFMRPESFRMADPSDPAAANRFEAVVNTQRFVGDAREVEFVLPEADSLVLRAKLPPHSELEKGGRIGVSIDPRDVLILEES